MGAALVGTLLAGCLAGADLAAFFAAFGEVWAAFFGVESFLAMVDRAAGSSRDASQQEKLKGMRNAECGIRNAECGMRKWVGMGREVGGNEGGGRRGRRAIFVEMRVFRHLTGVRGVEKP